MVLDGRLRAVDGAERRPATVAAAGALSAWQSVGRGTAGITQRRAGLRCRCEGMEESGVPSHGSSVAPPLRDAVQGWSAPGEHH